MNKISSALISTVILVSHAGDAFTVSPAFSTARLPNCNKQNIYRGTSQLFESSAEKQSEQDNEIERLRSMAAKLRAEAASLEVRASLMIKK